MLGGAEQFGEMRPESAERSAGAVGAGQAGLLTADGGKVSRSGEGMSCTRRKTG